MSIYQTHLSLDIQKQLIVLIEEVVIKAPWMDPVTSSGGNMHLKSTSCGFYGWYSDSNGYHYTETHPITTKPWPRMPDLIEDLAIKLATDAGFSSFRPEVCHVNYYQGSEAKLGLHQDASEKTYKTPIVSISLGDTAIFEIGGTYRGGPFRELQLNSGDCIVFGGEHRLAYHGIKKIWPDTSNMIAKGGRYNLTIRQVDP